MKKLTLTTLRQQIFKIADEVLMTGQPVSIERNGKVLLLCSAVEINKSKSLKLKRRKLISGDAESLHTVKVGEWHELENLA
jgi:PHD/YefM family antitoxin component YafN of YafNO toxin-antitoxin module